MGNNIYWYSFRRNCNENISTNETYTKDILIKVAFKYPEQAIFLFGVAKLETLPDNKSVDLKLD